MSLRNLSARLEVLGVGRCRSTAVQSVHQWTSNYRTIYDSVPWRYGPLPRVPVRPGSPPSASAMKRARRPPRSRRRLERMALAADIPTIEKTLKIKDFDLAAWTGLFGPTNLPKDIVDNLNGAMQKALNSPEMQERMLTNYIEPTPSDPATFAAVVKRQLSVRGNKVKVAGIQPG